MSAPDEIARVLAMMGDVRLACSCGLGEDCELTPGNVRSVMEHAAFAHASRSHVNLVRTVEFLTPYENALLIDAASQTTAEARWRWSPEGLDFASLVM